MEKTRNIWRCVSHAARTYWPWLASVLLVVFVIAAACALIGCRSAKSMPTERSVRDSVVYTYKTLYRDSVRTRDSTIIVYSYVQRDSVVVRVDAATGKVIGKDTWHWQGRDRSKERFADVRKTMDRADSVGSERLKLSNRVTMRSVENKAAAGKRSDKWRMFAYGVFAGWLLTRLWRSKEALVGVARRLLCR